MDITPRLSNIFTMWILRYISPHYCIIDTMGYPAPQYFIKVYDYQYH